jgi:hypothetical protein
MLQWYADNDAPPPADLAEPAPDVATAVATLATAMQAAAER